MKKPYYIDYPQEPFEGHAHRYRCAHCKEETTVINGKLEGHLPTCVYRKALSQAGFELEPATQKPEPHDADDFD